MKNKTVILGGSFNPFHMGHISMLETVAAEQKAGLKILLPSKKPPHKSAAEYASDKCRLEMLDLYAAGKENTLVLDIELKREGFSYTADTSEELKKLYPDDELIFIIGGDSLINFHKWYKPDIILKNFSIAVALRSDMSKAEAEDLISGLKEAYGGTFYISGYKPVDVSSTQIRELAGNGESISGLVIPEIEEYIKQNKLYTAKVRHGLDYYVEEMKKTLPEKRFRHSIGVMETAEELAYCHGVDVESAKIAAVLHDCAKYMPEDEMINLLGQNEIELGDVDLNNKSEVNALLHSKAGAVLAKNVYGVEDKDITDAIFYHTVGKPDMSTLQEIIFVADFIEPGRTQNCKPSLKELRELAKTDLKKTVYYICESTIAYLNRAGRKVNGDTLKTLEFYADKCGIKSKK